MLMNMKDILAVAKKHKFAIPAFNISDWSMFIGIMDLCEETNSPVIIEIHPDELRFTGAEVSGTGLHPSGPLRRFRHDHPCDPVRVHFRHV